MPPTSRRQARPPVPEWLNSPLWSVPPASPAADRRRSPYAISESPPPSPAPPPPAPKPEPETPQPAEKRKGGEHDEDAASKNHLVAEFKIALAKQVVSLTELRRLACLGVPDGGGIRATVWKLLLGYLPTEHALWMPELEKKRDRYSTYREELLLNPSEIIRRKEEAKGFKAKGRGSDGIGLLPRLEVSQEEHPLSHAKASVWNQYFQESDFIEQIDRDVKRTHPEMPFFSGDSYFSKSNQESLKRILTIYAKLNPVLRYVQGMNEVVAPLYYVFKTDQESNNSVFAEADTFYCFVELVSRIRDNFCKQLDNSSVGIHSMFAKLSQLLKKHDEELWRHLEVTKVYPQYYSFRWITTLLSREFTMIDCLHIWDTLLGDPEGPQDTLLRICCSMLILARRRLLAGDFTAILDLLQHYPPTNIDHLLHVANKLRGPILE